MEKSFVFNSINSDRRYLAEDFREYFASFIGNGVFPNPSTGLQVYSNEAMTVTVKEGKGWINGAIYVNTDDLILSIDPADGVLNRIDRIVLRFDTLNREIKIYVKKGTFASSPIAPALQRDADIYELALADVNIKAGSIEILQSNINDLRLNSVLCGIVVGTVKEIDTTTLYLKLQAYIDERGQEVEQWINDATTAWGEDFYYWFDTVKNALDGDAAGNLLNKILEVSKKVDEVEKDIKEEIKGDIEDLKQSVSDGKESIATAVTGKDVPTNGSDSFQKMADNIDSIKTKLPILEGDAGVAEDNEGNVYGVEKIEERQIYPDSLNATPLIWSFNTTDTNNLVPRFVSADSTGNVYVSCYSSNSGVLYKLTSDGKEIWKISFIYASKVIVDKYDNLYVSVDNGNSAGYYTSKLNPQDGSVIWKYMNTSTKGIAVDSMGGVYIARYGTTSSNNGRLIKLTPDGELSWNYSDWYIYDVAVDSLDYVYLAYNNMNSGKIKKISPDGKSDIWSYSFQYTRVVTVDNEGNVFASNNTGTIIKLTSEGNFLWEYNSNSEVFSISTDNLGYVYIANTGGRIIKLTSGGSLKWEHFLPGAYAVNVDNKQNVYATGQTNKEVIKFKDNYTLEKVAVLKEREV